MQAPGGSGALPLQEYRREVPPGWAPNDPETVHGKAEDLVSDLPGRR